MLPAEMNSPVFGTTSEMNRVRALIRKLALALTHWAPENNFDENKLKIGFRKLRIGQMPTRLNPRVIATWGYFFGFNGSHHGYWSSTRDNYKPVQICHLDAIRETLNYLGVSSDLPSYGTSPKSWTPFLMHSLKEIEEQRITTEETSGCGEKIALPKSRSQETRAHPTQLYRSLGKELSETQTRELLVRLLEKVFLNWSTLEHERLERENDDASPIRQAVSQLLERQEFRAAFFKKL